MERLREVRESKGISQQAVADYINLSRQAYSYYESGRSDPDTVTLAKIASFLGVTTDYLLGTSDSLLPSSTRNLIPVLGEVPAGVPIEAVEQVEEYIDLYPSFVKHGELFALKVKGRSMEPDIHNGDIVIVEKQDFISNGEIAVVRVNGEDVTVKRVKRIKGGLSLLPNNPTFPPAYFSDEEVATLPVTIIGKVIEIRRRL